MWKPFSAIVCIAVMHCIGVQSFTKRFSPKIHFTRLRGGNDPAGSLASHLENLNETIYNCVHKSLLDLKRGDGSYDDAETSKYLMGNWINQTALLQVMNSLRNSSLSPSSPVSSIILSSPRGIFIEISKSEEFDLNFFHVPMNYSFPSEHVSGTIILTAAVYGNGHITSCIKGRLISTTSLGESNQTIVRIGGPSRVIESSIGKALGVLELLIYPPSKIYRDANADNLPDIEKHLTRMQLKASDLTGLIVRKQTELTTTKRAQTERQLRLSVRKKLSSSVGGLGQEIDSIVRRILASRQLDPSLLQAMGLSHVKGLLLYGPPGTGKTLIAREIAKALNSRAPKIVNGPEIMDKYVGEAERNIRLLFSEAEREWASIGNKSPLHVIIFDEIDAIAKKRGTLGGDGSGVRDSVVNQLLCQLDGVNELNNVLVIGLTNRKDLLDPALLRPGRFEVQIEVKLPDRYGREEILAIHLRPLVKSGLLSLPLAVDAIGLIGRQSTGFSGAELTGVIRSSLSFALERHYSLMNEDGYISSSELDSKAESVDQISMRNLTLVETDFARGLSEFMENRLVNSGILKKNPFQLRKAFKSLINKVVKLTKDPLKASPSSDARIQGILQEEEFD